VVRGAYRGPLFVQERIMHTEYRHLNPDRLTETADRLVNRVVARFPHSGLAKVTVTVSEVTREAFATAEEIRRPNWWLRIGLIGLAVLVLAGAVLIALTLPEEASTPARLAEALFKTQGAVVFISAIVVFLWTLEARFKRRKAVKAIHDLRTLAHIIDMHQLSKDPEYPKEGDQAYATVEAMTQYLHYCSEMLAIISKIGQLYVEDFHDTTTLTAVDNLESLTTGLSQKIWQKLMILEQIRSGETAEASK
jgi:hypothetical protein